MKLSSGLGFFYPVFCLFLGIGLVQAALRIEKPTKDSELAVLKIANVHYTWARVNRVICGASKADDLYFGISYSINRGPWITTRGEFSEACEDQCPKGCELWTVLVQATFQNLPLVKGDTTQDIEYALFAGVPKTANRPSQIVWDNNGGYKKNYKAHYPKESIAIPEIPIDNIKTEFKLAKRQDGSLGVVGRVTFTITPAQFGNSAWLTIRVNEGKAVKIHGERPDRQIAVGPTKVPVGFGYEEWTIDVDIPVTDKRNHKMRSAENRVRIEWSLTGMGSGRQKKTPERIEELTYNKNM